MLRSLLQPDWYLGNTISELSVDKLAKRHIKVLILDVDCTLLPPCNSNVPASVMEWIDKAKYYFKLYLFSNNPSTSRVGKLSQKLDIPFTSAAGKPRKEVLKKVISKIKIPCRQIGLVGDRLFTDTVTGNRLGLFTVLVSPTDMDGYPYRHGQLQNIELQLSRWLGASIH